jgi:hypothetical protein
LPLPVPVGVHAAPGQPDDNYAEEEQDDDSRGNDREPVQPAHIILIPSPRSGKLQ